MVPKLTMGNKNPFASKECIDILNFRIEQEEQSSRLYHAMSIWLNDNGFIGSAKKWQKDSDDEMVHASWAKEFLLDLGIKPKIPALKEPEQTFKGLVDVIKKSFDHEVTVTKQCNDLASHAMKYGNHMLYQLAMIYLKEQQEELGKLQTIIDRLNAFGETNDVLFMLDEEFGK